MKKSYFYLVLLLPLIFLTYYFFIHKQNSKSLGFEPDIKNFQNLKVSLYSKENLYDYLNGGADKIIDLGLIYLKVWQGNLKESELSIELYYFKPKESARKLFENFSKNKEKNYKNYKYEIIEDQGTTFAGNYFLKINTYPPNLDLIEKNIKDFLENAYEKKL